MKPRHTADIWLALFFLAFALILVFVWIPLDTDTGLVEKVRRKFVIGDALAPTVAAVVIALGAGFVLLRPAPGKSLSRENVIWCVCLLGLFTTSLFAMRYAGPLVAIWTESGYRPLRATLPWKYIGYLLGGTFMIGGLTGMAMRRLSVKDFAIGFIATLLIALAYDLPFDDLILPPNGDI